MGCVATLGASRLRSVSAKGELFYAGVLHKFGDRRMAPSSLDMINVHLCTINDRRSRSLCTGSPDEMSQAKQSTGHIILHIVGRPILSPMPYSEGFLQVDVNMGSYFCILFPCRNNSIHHPNDKTPELCCPYLTMRFMRPPQ